MRRVLSFAVLLFAAAAAKTKKPGTLLLLGPGIAGLAILARRRMRRE